MPPPFRPDWAFFLDLDGTLFEIRTSPDAVRRDAAEVQLVARLFEATGGAVALVSGRALGTIDALFAPLKLPAAGQHGAERRDARGRVTRVELPSKPFDAAAKLLRGFAARHKGLLFEHKGLSMALHYRLAPQLGEQARAAVEQAASLVGSAMEMQSGKMVFELKPAGLDKGKAIEAFMRESPFAGRVPMFIGDDQTDEHGFRLVNSLGGDSVKVGDGESEAHWRLEGPAAVRAWLAQGLERAARR
jgi:trehalose 6-phosphate phosphatase